MKTCMVLNINLIGVCLCAGFQLLLLLSERSAVRLFLKFSVKIVKILGMRSSQIWPNRCQVVCDPRCNRFAYAHRTVHALKIRHFWIGLGFTFTLVEKPTTPFINRWLCVSVPLSSVSFSFDRFKFACARARSSNPTVEREHSRFRTNAICYRLTTGIVNWLLLLWRFFWLLLLLHWTSKTSDMVNLCRCLSSRQFLLPWNQCAVNRIKYTSPT